jgi:hypothetical protein
MPRKKGMLRVVVAIVFAIFLSLPPVVWAEEENKPEGTEIVFDLVIARPVGMVGLALGTSFFLISYPIAVLTGSGKNTAHALVAEPFNFTFVRGLGEY